MHALSLQDTNHMNTSHNTTKHYAQIDFMRAVLIALVILIHIVHFGNLYPAAKSAILAFIMPAFLVITGYLVNTAKPVAAYAKYLWRIILPYTIMVTGYMILSLHLPVRDGIEHFDLPTVCHTLFIRPIGPYWFLHAMTVCGVLYYAAFRSLAQCSVATRLCAFATLLVCTSQFTPFLSLNNAAYYFTGVAIRWSVGDFSRISRGSLLAAVPFGFFLFSHGMHDWSTLWVFGAVFCFFSLSTRLYELSGHALRRTAEYIGRNTLPIYIFHPIFTMAAKFMLPIFAFDPTGLAHAAFTIALGIGGGLAIAFFLDKTRIAYIFGKAKMLR